MSTPSRPRTLRAAGALTAFLTAESIGALVLLVATASTLVLANSPWAGAYEDLWQTEVALSLGDRPLVTLDLRHGVNELLMTLFFFGVGLEIKRELVGGELADRRKAALPIVAALGGMLVPALVYLVFNAGGSGQRGWGIPIATDIAFALGVFALLGRGLPAGLRVFLLSLAIADDIGSIAIIAVFYSAAIDVVALVIAIAILGAVAALWRVRASWTEVPIAVLMVANWVAVLAAGIHPTISGVALGLATPAGSNGAPSPAERIGRSFHPWTSYVVVPMFALANAGIVIDADALRVAASSPITLGIVCGLVLGKLVGVTGGAYVAVRVGLAVLPREVRWSQIVAVAAVAGIGYTVSLFIAGLSFVDAGVEGEAKVGILVGSTVAALLGGILLRFSSGLAQVSDRDAAHATPRDDRRDVPAAARGELEAGSVRN